LRLDSQSQVLARRRLSVIRLRRKSDGPPALVAAADPPAPLAVSLSRFLPAKLQFSLHHKSASRSVEGGQARAGQGRAGERGWRARPRTPRPLPPWWRWPRATATARASEAAAPRAPTRSASAPLGPVPFLLNSDSVASGLDGVVVRDGAMQGETVRRIESLFPVEWTRQGLFAGGFYLWLTGNLESEIKKKTKGNFMGVYGSIKWVARGKKIRGPPILVTGFMLLVNRSSRKMNVNGLPSQQY
jgi:hypothetical protein